MRQFFTIKVKTINQQVQEHPPTLNFLCDEVVPQGPGLVREIDSPNECITTYKVFMFRQGSDLYGTTEVKTMAEWRQYINANCKCCPEPEGCFITVDGCVIAINGCKIAIECSLCN